VLLIFPIIITIIALMLVNWLKKVFLILHVSFEIVQNLIALLKFSYRIIFKGKSIWFVTIKSNAINDFRPLVYCITINFLKPPFTTIKKTTKNQSIK